MVFHQGFYCKIVIFLVLDPTSPSTTSGWDIGPPLPAFSSSVQDGIYARVLERVHDYALHPLKSFPTFFETVQGLSSVSSSQTHLLQATDGVMSLFVPSLCIYVSSLLTTNSPRTSRPRSTDNGFGCSKPERHVNVQRSPPQGGHETWRWLCFCLFFSRRVQLRYISWPVKCKGHIRAKQSSSQVLVTLCVACTLYVGRGLGNIKVDLFKEGRNWNGRIHDTRSSMQSFIPSTPD